MSFCICRKLKEQERKVKGGEEKEDMIDTTEIDTKINTEGFVSHMSESLSINVFLSIFSRPFRFLNYLCYESHNELSQGICVLTKISGDIQHFPGSL